MSFSAAEVSFSKVPFVIAAGTGYRLLDAGASLEAGDEYCTPGGLFVALPPALVGQAVPQGVPVRRPAR